MSDYEKSLKRRPKVEYFGEYIIRPLAHLVVVPFAAIKFKPHWLVLMHTCMGVLAGVLIAKSEFLIAAVLIMLKTILDAADGQLARMTNQTTEFGRYLDSEGDVVVNVALFVGIAIFTKLWFASLLAFFVLTIFLSLDFNLEFLYQSVRGKEFRAAPQLVSAEKWTRLLKQMYDVFFGIQDKAIRTFHNQRFEKITKAFSGPDLELQPAQIVYNDETAIFVLTNLGLAEQMTVLAVCLLFHKPQYFLVFVFVCACLVLLLQFRRENNLINFLKKSK